MRNQYYGSDPAYQLAMEENADKFIPDNQPVVMICRAQWGKEKCPCSVCRRETGRS